MEKNPEMRGLKVQRIGTQFYIFFKSNEKAPGKKFRS